MNNTYQAYITLTDFNYQEFYMLKVVNKKTNEWWFNDKPICELIGITEEEFRSYCVKNFHGVDIYKDVILFEWNYHAKSAEKWLNSKLDPLNLIEKLSEV